MKFGHGLGNEELSDLTGRSQPAAQIRWLKERNRRFEIGLDRLPKVARAYFDRRMVPGDDESVIGFNPMISDEWRVNTEALARRPALHFHEYPLTSAGSPSSRRSSIIR